MWKAIKLALYSWAYQLAVTIVAYLIFIVIYLLQGKPIESLHLSKWPLAISLVVSTLLIMWHLVHFKYVKIKRDILKPVSFRWLPYAILLVILSFYVVGVLSGMLDLPSLLKDRTDLSKNSLGLITMTLATPILEEMLFRGAIERHLLHIGKSPAFAIIISSIIYGIIRINPEQVIFAFFMGLILGWIYYRTGSLIPTMLGHILNNSLVAISILLGYKDYDEMMGGTTMYIVAAVAAVISVGLFFVLNRSLPKIDFRENQSDIA